MSKHLKIALVDDDKPNVEILHDFLIRSGYSHIEKYYSGEDFLKSLHLHDDRAVILDYGLSDTGGMNGLEVLEQIKDASPNTHVLFYSGQDSLDVAVESLKMGADDYIVKSAAGVVLLKTAMDKVYEIQVLKFGERRNQRLSWIFAGLWIVAMVAAAYFAMR
jgi:DNA-binding response OmpR family regulator